MSKEEKLKERFKRLPKDFTFEELRRLLRNIYLFLITNGYL